LNFNGSLNKVAECLLLSTFLYTYSNWSNSHSYHNPSHLLLEPGHYNTVSSRCFWNYVGPLFFHILLVEKIALASNSLFGLLWDNLPLEKIALLIRFLTWYTNKTNSYSSFKAESLDWNHSYWSLFIIWKMFGFYYCIMPLIFHHWNARVFSMKLKCIN
jgi:hypothetical protein